VRTLTVISLVTAALLLALTATPAAAAPAPAYALIDVGTFGGPQAFLNLPGYPITNQGTVLGTADTTIADDDFPNFNPFMVGFPNPTLVHAFAWQRGQLEDLGALPGNNSSAVFQVNGGGIGAGMSETPITDPYTGWPADHATMFRDGQVVDLGTLPGGYESQANAINDRGQIAGFAQDGVPDPFSIFGWGTEVRSFIWQNGVMQDLGTLGGPDAVMTELNSRGQIAGDSYTNATPNPTTGSPTLHPFLWTQGDMRDLGSLGGTLSFTNWINDAGEVVGASFLAGDQSFHPYLWDGAHLRDLGSLGGDFGAGMKVSDAGHVAGWTTLPGNGAAHAFLWKNGVMTDLTGAASSECTIAEALNNRDQVVGHTCDEEDALLWADGKQYDLNALVGPSDVQLTAAVFVNAQGQIAAVGRIPGGDQHVFLLNPTNSKLPAASSGLAGHRAGVQEVLTRSLSHSTRFRAGI
jgi:probable HAF family extracellular repeat protein